MQPSRDDAENLTGILHRWRGGEDGAFEALIPLVYDQLRRLARARLRVEQLGHTLDTTGLVHETYLRLVESGGAEWRDRAHFFAVASTAMRRILIDHARQHHTQKRGGAPIQIDFETAKLGDAGIVASEDPGMLLALDDALTKLESLYPRPAKAVELRYFAGLTLDEAAVVLDVSPPTVMRDVRFAEAWLAKELS